MCSLVLAGYRIIDKVQKPINFENAMYLDMGILVYISHFPAEGRLQPN
jgi:hypothetical protein